MNIRDKNTQSDNVRRFQYFNHPQSKGHGESESTVHLDSLVQARDKNIQSDNMRRFRYFNYSQNKGNGDNTTKKFDFQPQVQTVEGQRFSFNKLINHFVDLKTLDKPNDLSKSNKIQKK